MNPEIRNAQIKSTQLGYIEGHFTCWLDLKYGPALGQGFGGYCLTPRGEESYAAQFVQGVLRAAGVETWEQLPGVYIRAKIVDGLIYAIGNIIEDVWFVPVGPGAPRIEDETGQ